MEKTMIPSTETLAEGQIGKFQELLGARLRKIGKQFPRNCSQEVLEHHAEKLVDGCIAVFQNLLDNVSKIIIRRVSVDRTRSAQEALDATGRKQYTDKKVVATMPKAMSSETEVHFVNFGEYVPARELKDRVDALGYRLADPFTLAAFNEADPSFADEHPNGTQWKDKNGKFCYAIFYDWYDARWVYVDQGDDVWGGRWWVAVVRK